jgi:bifunctional UDP-N-acetylglucosamine pyrophosphorylase/glucosamine-1-phosphate N-acetyltransferase
MWDMNDVTHAVILAAGKGTRMLPLTLEKPKPMIEVLGKNLIEWKLAALPASVTNVVLVIGYQGEKIKEYFGDLYEGRRMHYAEQEELNGNAVALFCAKDFLRGRFLVMMGDDLYSREDIKNICAHELAVLVKEVWDKEIGGEMTANADGTFLSIDEPKHHVEHGLINTGLYTLDMRYFDYPLVLIGGSSKEFGLPHTLTGLAKDAPVQMVKATAWMQISAPEDLPQGELFIKEHLV